MAQTNFTPISLYYSATSTNVPTAGNLVAGELAINTADGKLFYKDSSGVVQTIAGKGGAGIAGGSTTQVQYNSSGSLAGSANMTFSGTALTLANDAFISGLTVGKGGGAVSTNTAVGANALLATATGTNNTGIGNNALYALTSGSENTAVGDASLAANTTGGQNVSFGRQSLRNNTTGNYNTALGMASLINNTTASNNTAVGYQAGYSSATATGQAFFGYQAGVNSTGNYNTLIGGGAGTGLTTGTNNTFVGAYSAYNVTTGSKNTVIGLFNGNQLGLDIRTASNYIVLSDGDGNPYAFVNPSGYFKTTNSVTGGLNSITGAYAEFGQTADNNALMVQNFNASQTGNGFIYISNRNTTNNTFYAISYYNNSANAYKFRVADSGNVTNTNNSYAGISDIKLKENIVDATPKLEDLCKVKVRQYNLKSEPDRKQIGVIAQELEEVFAGMVEESADKDIDNNDLGTTTKSVKYSVFVPMLIKAIQELNAKVTALEAKLGA
jgi:hypothetical protein